MLCNLHRLSVYSWNSQSEVSGTSFFQCPEGGGIEVTSNIVKVLSGLSYRYNDPRTERTQRAALAFPRIPVWATLRHHPSSLLSPLLVPPSVAARCWVPSRRLTSFFPLADQIFFLFSSHRQPVWHFSSGFRDAVLPHTPTIIGELCSSRRTNLSRWQGEEVSIQSGGCSEFGRTEPLRSCTPCTLHRGSQWSDGFRQNTKFACLFRKWLLRATQGGCSIAGFRRDSNLRLPRGQALSASSPRKSGRDP